MFIGNSEMFIFSGLLLSHRSNGEKLTRFTISADTFAGIYITEQIEKRCPIILLFKLTEAVEASFVSPWQR